MSAHTGFSDNYDVGATTLYYIGALLKNKWRPGREINFSSNLYSY